MTKDGSIRLVIIIAGLYFLPANGLVKLYDSLAFEGLLFQNTPNENCSAIPSYGWDVASSLKTDQCIMAYTTEACGGSSIKIPPGEYPDLKEIQRPNLNFDNKIKSYRTCTQGEALTVTLRTGYNNDENSAVIVTFNDICGCVNLPIYAIGKVNSLDNRGNCVKLHSELECRGSNVEIPGGAGSDTLNLTNAGFNAVTKSVSGCGAAASCVRLTSVIRNIAIKSVPVNILPVGTDLITMASNVTYTNDGAAAVDEEYEASKEVDELVTVTVNSAMRTMYRSSVSGNVAIESDIGIPVLSGNELISLFSSAYTFSNGPGAIARDKVVDNRTKLFAAKEKIQILPCSSYTLTSAVKYVHNYPADYELVAQISGVTGDRAMTAEQVKASLEESLEYVEDLDNNTVIAKGNGTITASFGIEAVIIGEGTKIPACTFQANNANLRRISLVEEV